MESHHHWSSSASVSGPVTQNVPLESNTSYSERQRPKFTLPSMFQSKVKHSKKDEPKTKSVKYLRDISASVSGPVTQNVPLESNTSYSERKRPKFTLPSMFQSKVKHSKKDEPKTKSVKYLRDIFAFLTRVVK